MRKLLEWRDLMIPIGAAILTVGVNQLEDRRQHAEENLERLEQAVTLRRAQLDGEVPLDREPEPPARISTGWKIAGYAAAAVGMLVVAAAGAERFLQIFHPLGDVEEDAAYADTRVVDVDRVISEVNNIVAPDVEPADVARQRDGSQE